MLITKPSIKLIDQTQLLYTGLFTFSFSDTNIMDLDPPPDSTSLKSLLQLKKQYDAPTKDELPEGYRKNSDKEKLYIWAADNFRRQVRQRYPRLEPLCLVTRNECNTEKLVITFIKVREDSLTREKVGT